MANKFVNPFDTLISEEKEVVIEDFGTVVIRDLTMAESDGFNKRLLKNYTGKGDPEIDMAEATAINYEKVALAMVKPTMTVKQLQALPSSASKVIGEIVKAIDGREDNEEGNEGNED